MSPDELLHSLRSRSLIIAGGTALLCGLIGLIVSLVRAWRHGCGRGLGLVAGLLTVAGGALLAPGAVTLASAVASQLVGAKVWFQKMSASSTDALHYLAAQELRALLDSPKHREPKDLNRHEYRVFSQNGEDGIIAEIFRRIGTTNRYFVEFGSSDGFENNTALLVRQGWSGLWIDGDHRAILRAREHFRPEVEAKKLTITETFITAENIEDLFRHDGVPEEFDLLSIDIDRNDYYVWEKIVHYRPRVVIVEYNPLVPAHDVLGNPLRRERDVGRDLAYGGEPEGIGRARGQEGLQPCRLRHQRRECVLRPEGSTRRPLR